MSEPAVGTKIRLHPDPPAGYILAASWPVRRMKATVTNPTAAPIARLRASER
jgi:hypothetical protein